MDRISIIIPTLNEEACIEATVRSALERKEEGDLEIIVADGGSEDRTAEIASRLVRVLACPRGRARQLNAAAQQATGDILFFVHADMQLPPGALTRIREMVRDEGYDGGGFSNVFSHHNQTIKRWGRILNLRLRSNDHAGNRIFFGDNGIFATRRAFQALGGFKDIPIMEDYDFSRRLGERFHSVRILEPRLIVSPRRHRKCGFVRTRLRWILIKRLFQLGVAPGHLSRFYPNVR